MADGEDIQPLACDDGLEWLRPSSCFKDESILAVDYPNDINEAVSSLIFASPRCADLPELPAIQKLLGVLWLEIKEKLSIKSVSDDAKYSLIDEIVRDHFHKPEILAIEYIPEMQKPGLQVG
ncbi:hypothetical protein COLO4_06752 [Corchorus olitorius]|uniref:Uncharacterized protein n=1 Tax=Corchorus olitorius TaxID=93759 RepID=A0A1R3KM54_9ROSI|nr:hypothetical protein COLO4_06752 [Corchorus olitorius]